MQVLVNLLMLTVKWTVSREVTGVSRLADGAGVTVIDDGRGTPRRSLERVLGRFTLVYASHAIPAPSP